MKHIFLVHRSWKNLFWCSAVPCFSRGNGTGSLIAAVMIVTIHPPTSLKSDSLAVTHPESGLLAVRLRHRCCPGELFSLCHHWEAMSRECSSHSTVQPGCSILTVMMKIGLVRNLTTGCKIGGVWHHVTYVHAGRIASKTPFEVSLVPGMWFVPHLRENRRT